MKKIYEYQFDEFLPQDSFLRLFIADPNFVSVKLPYNELVSRTLNDCYSFVSEAIESWNQRDSPLSVYEEINSSTRSFEKVITSQLSPAQTSSLPEGLHNLLGTAFVLFAKLDKLNLDNQQLNQLNEQKSKANTHAKNRIAKHMASIQVRNPNAYLAYAIVISNREFRIANQEQGAIFEMQYLTAMQREILNRFK